MVSRRVRQRFPRFNDGSQVRAIGVATRRGVSPAMDETARSRVEDDVKRDRISPRARSMDAVRAHAHAPRRLRCEAERARDAPGARATMLRFMIHVYRVHRRTRFGFSE